MGPKIRIFDYIGMHILFLFFLYFYIINEKQHFNFISPQNVLHYDGITKVKFNRNLEGKCIERNNTIVRMFFRNISLIPSRKLLLWSVNMRAVARSGYITIFAHLSSLEKFSKPSSYHISLTALD